MPQSVSTRARVPPSWRGWLAHTFDLPPSEEAYVPREWEMPHLPNMTGTAAAYRPQGSTRASGRRPAATGDYVAWSPEGQIEAIEDPDREFFLGVQWHAETLSHRPEHAALFDGLVRVARRPRRVSSAA